MRGTATTYRYLQERLRFLLCHACQAQSYHLSSAIACVNHLIALWDVECWVMWC